MPSPAFLVEGHMEQDIVKELCPGTRVQRLECNGDDVKTPVIARKIDLILRIWSNRHFPIILVLDREKRIASCNNFRASILSELHKLGHSNDQFQICIPDRSMETWLVADIKSVCKFYGIHENIANEVNCCEGKKGAGVIKSLLPKEIVYSKRADGVQIFKNLNINTAKENSASFSHFIDLMERLNQNGCFSNCWWLSQRAN